MGRAAISFCFRMEDISCAHRLDVNRSLTKHRKENKLKPELIAHVFSALPRKKELQPTVMKSFVCEQTMGKR
jgi:hypothetical protein